MIVNYFKWFLLCLPERHGANSIVFCATEEPEVKRFVLSLDQILVLVLREPAVIQETSVEASLRDRKFIRLFLEHVPASGRATLNGVFSCLRNVRTFRWKNKWRTSWFFHSKYHGEPELSRLGVESTADGTWRIWDVKRREFFLLLLLPLPLLLRCLTSSDLLVSLRETIIKPPDRTSQIQMTWTSSWPLSETWCS